MIIITIIGFFPIIRQYFSLVILNCLILSYLTFGIGFENILTRNKNNRMNNSIIQKSKHQYSLIIPCNNEEKKFPFKYFLHFAQKNPEVLLCFVNNGSMDNTLGMIRGMQTDSPQNICVYLLDKIVDKVEAVRQGMMYISKNSSVQLLGYLDTDLDTKPEEWLEMAKHKDQNPKFGAIVGRRFQRFGANINTDDKSSLFSRIIKMVIQLILKSPFQNIYRGAKIFERNLVPFLFNRPFIAPWLIDVEIFLRLQKKFGRSTLQKGILEFPLVKWKETSDSGLQLKQTIKTPFQLLKLHYQYNIAKKFIPKPEYSLFDKQNSLLVSMELHFKLEEINLQKNNV